MIRLDAVATYARAMPGHVALADLATGRRWSYAELDQAVSRLAAWIVGQWGPNSG